MNPTIELLLTVGKLKKLTRTGWILSGIKNPESVAEHSFRVALMSMLLSKELGLNESKMMKLALIHDLAEAEVGDIVTDGSGVQMGKEEKHLLEKKGIEEIFKNHPQKKKYLALWNEYEEQKTPEAKAVYTMDKLEMALQATEYEKSDGKDLSEFMLESKNYIKEKKLSKLNSEIKKLREHK